MPPENIWEVLLMTKSELEKKWASRIAAYRASGQTQIAFCKAEGVSHRQLCYWLRKETQKGPVQIDSHKWIPVEVSNKRQTYESSSIQIKLGLAEVVVKSGFDQELLLGVLRTLRSLC